MLLLSRIGTRSRWMREAFGICREDTVGYGHVTSRTKYNNVRNNEDWTFSTLEEEEEDQDLENKQNDHNILS